MGGWELYPFYAYRFGTERAAERAIKRMGESGQVMGVFIVTIKQGGNWNG